MTRLASATWVPAPTEDGSWTLVHAELGEACHSLSGAWQQATERYAGPCRLGERGDGATRLLDVGTGLGLNLAAALAAVEPRGGALHALSLELDPAVIALGCELYERSELRAGPWERWHAPVRAALRAALERPGEPVPLGRAGALELRLGDARANLPRAPAALDAIFLDPFSPARAGELWAEPFLAALARTLASGGWLSTYGAAFRVRLALLRAGLAVGRGPRVGAKGEGTLATRDGEPPELPSRVARRLARRLATPPAGP